MTPQQIATVAGAATSTATNPLAGAMVTNALLAIIEDRAEEREHLKLIGEKMDGLVEGKYDTGMEYLKQAARPYRSGEDRRRFIDDARHSFMEAHGQERNLFRKALIEYQLGNCWTLLGSMEDARHWFERAHASAESYLKDLGKPLTRANYWEAMPWYSLSVYGERQSVSRAYDKAKEELLKEVPAVLDLLDALESLKPALGLKLSPLALTQSTVKKWLDRHDPEGPHSFYNKKWLKRLPLELEVFQKDIRLQRSDPGWWFPGDLPGYARKTLEKKD
jgi:tetratricopeptide (TPR) repeat protein